MARLPIREAGYPATVPSEGRRFGGGKGRECLATRLSGQRGASRSGAAKLKAFDEFYADIERWAQDFKAEDQVEAKLLQRNRR